MSLPIRRVRTFRSDTNPDLEYQTLQYTDGSTSCACKGWTRRVSPDGSRSCKHTRWVDMGTADRHCTATHSYDNHNQTTNHAKHQVKHTIKSFPELGRRKFAL